MSKLFFFKITDHGRTWEVEHSTSCSKGTDPDIIFTVVASAEALQLKHGWHHTANHDDELVQEEEE